MSCFSPAIRTIFVLALAVSGLAAVRCACGDDDLRVLDPASQPPPSRLLYADLQRQAHAALDRRGQQYEALASPDDAARWQTERRAFFVRQLGGFPERTPLNAQVVGRVEAGDYTIEKVLFESRPQHHVTALMYLPATPPPYPCVIVASGHSRTGKAADYNQRFGIIMARHGMAALCYDPIGQGERSQILNDQGEPKFGSTVTEHFQIGVGAILVGTNTAAYRIWDGMRAIDYAAGRNDIRADRIGFTGCSGGGTLTSYVMALDDRVASAAPSCYLTTFRRLIDTIGPQDAEQNIFGQVAFGLDHPDYVLLRAPRPTLISATTGDYFDIEGAWANFRQAKRFYGRLGFPERVDLVEGDGGHGVPMTNLVAIMRWMQRWLLDHDGAATEGEIDVHPLDALRCTPAGQVLALPGEKSVFTLNAERQTGLAAKRAEFQRTAQPAALRDKIRALAGMRAPAELPRLQVLGQGSIEPGDFRVDKLLLQRDEGIPLPALLFVPREPRPEAYLYLHGEGMQAAANEPGGIEPLVRRGHIVLAVDLPGIGETRGEKSDGPLGTWKDFYLAYLLGKSLTGIRAEAAIQAAHTLATMPIGGTAANNGDAPESGTDSAAAVRRTVHAVASGEAVIPTLHAAATSEAIAVLHLPDGEVAPWATLVPRSETDNQLAGTVHAALAFYDLPDLIRLHGQVSLRSPEPGGTR